ncbi:MAG: DMSO/selenate family reductase complex B subunit [Bacteroidales bacterium]|nr:DMSO/selenate family reductase complex B subunit [Bacteroidales bacterium]
MSQLAFYFDASACSGCKTCQMACKDKHNSPPGVRWRRVYEICGGEWRKNGHAWEQNMKAYHISMACNHCEEPICLHRCPNKAIIKNQQGVVLINYDRCMGCRYCEWTCPYGALQFDPVQKVMTKCNFCADYLEEGKPPSCVSACPMRVLDFGAMEDLAKKYGKNNEDFPLPEEYHTRPALVITSHKHAGEAVKTKYHIINKEEVR